MLSYTPLLSGGVSAICGCVVLTCRQHCLPELCNLQSTPKWEYVFVWVVSCAPVGKRRSGVCSNPFPDEYYCPVDGGNVKQ